MYRHDLRISLALSVGVVGLSARGDGVALKAGDALVEVEAPVGEGVKPGGDHAQEAREEAQESGDDAEVASVPDGAEQGLDEQVEHEDQPVARDCVPPRVAEVEADRQQTEDDRGPDI